MEDLLFLSQRIPYPPTKGDKIRSFNILRHLARTYRIHLGCFIDDPEDWSHVESVRDLCADSNFIALNPNLAKIRCMTGLLTGEPLSVPYFRDAKLLAWVRQVLDRVEPAVAFIFSSVMAQYLLEAPSRPRRIVMDFVDVDSDKWRQYAATRTWPLGWIYERENRMLLEFDRQIARTMDVNIFVSEPEAELFRRLAPESARRTFAIGNGIDANFFSPDAVYPRPIDMAGPALVFTGAMDYWANVDAVTWFAKDIFPIICESVENASFIIVGSNPTAEVVRLGERAGVHVTGRVADVRPYLANAAAVVVPIRIARGLQNKILEAMAMGKTVITTPQALEGIDAEPGSEVLVAADVANFAHRAIEAIDNPSAHRIGQAARERVVGAYAWPTKLASLDGLIAGTSDIVD